MFKNNANRDIICHQEEIRLYSFGLLINKRQDGICSNFALIFFVNFLNTNLSNLLYIHQDANGHKL